MTTKQSILTYVLAFLFGLLGSVVGNAYLGHRSQNTIIGEYYQSENAVRVSPSTLKKRINEKDTSFVLVDLRSKKEYDTEHIINAINIPAVSMTPEQVVKAFAALPKDKEIIVHCYSMACMLGRQTGKLLSENGIYVKELNIGWSEWRYYWGLWNPGEPPEKGNEYIVSSPNTNATDAATIVAPCLVGQLGC